MTEARDRSPPWVLFVDNNRPIAILPAMRPGEVANVEHLTMRQAKEIVALANKIHDMLVIAKLQRIESILTAGLEEMATAEGSGVSPSGPGRQPK